ncbi:hypothetical protein LY71_10180 [Geodermatophilus tzadiensis]|uniref:Secreted protein n=1 Tax=Geodermatophilus tzadiensis TaxID=1137988 RepID=A0A2T0U199_9ACTN|nr:hypothetical protein [Geodermatophilus tzadiensis]PRY51710.1 hypothetical protein LY71_10180 [Geodermatophilus tzadiensis]
MNRLSRLGVVLVAGGTVALTASPAWAHAGGTAPDDDAGWVPIEELRPGFYDPVDISACGTTVTLATGDVADVEGRETTLPDGDLLFETRGEQTADLTRQDTGEVIDELDISGSLSELIAADGLHSVSHLYGPSVVFPIPEFGPVDAAAFEAAGLPDLGYFREGVITFTVVLDPETGEFASEDIDVDARVVDLCTWFDGDRGQAHGHDHGDHG